MSHEDKTIGTAWIKLICLPLIVVLAFVVFCTALVAALIGYIDPNSTPGAELASVARGVDNIHRALTTPIL